MLSTRRDLEHLATDTGFPAASLERVIRLAEMLSAMGRHPALQKKLLLKGGTALNLLQSSPRRLSVDLDFNYVGSPEREAMLGERPMIEDAVEAVGRSLDFSVQRSRDSHAGRKLYFSYLSLLGTPDRIEVDLNFLHRVALLDGEVRELWHPDGSSGPAVRVLAGAELAAGKLCALLDRCAVRDLWDVARFPQLVRPWPPPYLRPVFVAFAGSLPHPLSSYDLGRALRIDDLEIERTLRPMLVRSERDRLSNLRDDAREIVEPLLTLTLEEREFTERLQSGEIAADLLFPDDPVLADRVSRHPVLRWKARNAARHRPKG